MNSMLNIRGLKYVVWDGIKRFRCISNQLFETYYNANLAHSNQGQTIVVAMVDGLVKHGGLTDRLRGVIYTYRWCKENQVPFRINFTYPFPLENFLVPNIYDWRLKPNELSKNSRISHPMYADVMGMHPWEPFMRNYYFRFTMRRLLRKYKQVHVYSNLTGVEKEEYTILFNELFQPSDFFESRA